MQFFQTSAPAQMVTGCNIKFDLVVFRPMLAALKYLLS
jgi:hypothetical protein